MVIVFNQTDIPIVLLNLIYILLFDLFKPNGILLCSIKIILTINYNKFKLTTGNNILWVMLQFKMVKSTDGSLQIEYTNKKLI